MVLNVRPHASSLIYATRKLTFPLQDDLFHNLSYSSWKKTIEPKVHGTQNLHEVLQEQPLDFFICTSSISGITGTPGQANYAAVNSYLDTLSLYRKYQTQTRGYKQPSTSIILPMVLGVGVVTRNADIEESLSNQGLYGIDEETLLRAFHVAIHQSHVDEGEVVDHLVLGLEANELRKAARAISSNLESFWTADARFSGLAYAISQGADTATTGIEMDLISSRR
jgi:hypothetical protein